MQEFLRDRNSCISTGFFGFLRIPPDSSRFLQIPAGFLFLPKLSGSGQPTNSPSTSSSSSKPTMNSHRQVLPSTPSTPPNMFYSVQYHVLVQLNLKPKTKTRITLRVVQGKVVGRAAVLLCLRRSACSCQQWQGVGGSALAGDVVAYVVGILTVLVPARWCQKRRDPTINMRWRG